MLRLLLSYITTKLKYFMLFSPFVKDEGNSLATLNLISCQALRKLFEYNMCTV